MTGANSYSTAQENFWAGRFGDEYTERNGGAALEASNRWLFAAALKAAGPINSVLELGANVGTNLLAIKSLFPDVTCDAVEINSSAAGLLRQRLGEDHVHVTSLLDFHGAPSTWDLVLCKGVLIHVAPADLPRAYAVIQQSSARLVLIAEYYSPQPQVVAYRGHADRLFKRDFAGEFLDACPDFALRDYGFVYRRDPVAPQDDINWFLLERSTRDGALR